MTSHHRPLPHLHRQRRRWQIDAEPRHEPRRIVGLRAGQIVFDGPAAELTAEVLTSIYGEEDWSQTIRAVEDDEDEHVPA